MPQGQANRVDVYYAAETTWGETPGGTVNMTQLPYNSETLVHSKATVLSNSIRSDRMRDTLAEVSARAEGGINYELRFTDYQTFFEHALGSVFTTTTKTGTGGAGDLQFTGNDIVGPGGSWTSFVVGQFVRITGSSGGTNDGIRKVTAKTSTNLTCDGSAFSAQNNSTATVAGKYLRNGTTAKSLLIEKRFNDLTQFVYFTGMRVGQMSLSVNSGEIITGSFTFLGEEGKAQGSSIKGGGTDTLQSSEDVMNATSNVGSLTEGGTALATAVKSISLNLNNNLRELMKVASRTAIGVNYGTVDITGTIEAYFEDATLYNKFINHTASSLSFRCIDPAGTKTLIFTLPRLFFGNGNPQVSGINTDIMLPLDFTAVRDSTTSCEIQIDALS